MLVKIFGVSEKHINSEIALEFCDLYPNTKPESQNIRIDHYWRKSGKILNGDGTQKYSQLFDLVKYCFSLSHSNCTLERGFSINKYFIDMHGLSAREETIESLRIIKDELFRVGAVLKFSTNKALIDSVKDSHSKYNADLEMKKSIKEKEAAQLSKNGKKIMKEVKQIDEVEKQISQVERSLFITEQNVVEGNSKLQEVLSEKSLSRDKIQKAQAMIDMGLERKVAFRKSLGELKENKKK